MIGFDYGWQRIEVDGIRKVQSLLEDFLHNNRQSNIGLSNKEYVELYTVVYKMCNQAPPHDHSRKLYEHFDQAITGYLKDMALPAIQRFEDCITMLSALGRQWSNYKVMTRWFCAIFMYLDRFYVKREHRVPLKTICLVRFNVLVFQIVREQTTRAVLQLIEEDREGRAKIDRSELRSFMRMYIELCMGDMKLYKNQLEAQILEETLLFYKRWASAHIRERIPDYLAQAEEVIKKERERIADYFDATSRDKIMQQTCQPILLTHRATILTDSPTSMKWMLKKNLKGDIRRVFRLYSQFSSCSLQPLAKNFQDHIRSQGEGLRTQENLRVYIPNLMEKHRENFELVSMCFNNEAAFHKALKEGFVDVVNQKPPSSTSKTPSELLADYADDLLRVKSHTEEVLRDLKALFELVSYLVEKDRFLKFYQMHLCKRLLTNSCTSDHTEKEMIGKIKKYDGATQLEGMMNDCNAARDNDKKFENFLSQNRRDLGFNFTVQVLTQSFWPSFEEVEPTLDSSMKRAITTFEAFWTRLKQKRTLKWQHSLGVVTINGKFAKRDVLMDVSTIQACILMIFNSVDSIRIKDLIMQLKIDAKEIKRQLKPICSNKFKILAKDPHKGYNVEHMLSVNSAWNPPREFRHIKIPLQVTKTTSAERSQNQKILLKDRNKLVDAWMMRTMKIRKRLSHRELVAEVRERLKDKFRPKDRLLKERIEALKDQEYIKEDIDERGVYIYQA